MNGEIKVFELGAPETWRDYVGGRIPTQGRKFLDQDLALEFFGISVNVRLPGEDAGYWHSHSTLEELYLFLEGEGEMALDGQVVQVRPGTAVKVGQGVKRHWRCRPDSAQPLRWICVRGGGGRLAEQQNDSTRDMAPGPWGPASKAA